MLFWRVSLSETKGLCSIEARFFATLRMTSERPIDIKEKIKKAGRPNSQLNNAAELSSDERARADKDGAQTFVLLDIIDVDAIARPRGVDHFPAAEA